MCVCVPGTDTQLTEGSSVSVTHTDSGPELFSGAANPEWGNFEQQQQRPPAVPASQ